MDVTSLLNMASTASATEGGALQPIHERKDSSDDELMDALRTPSATATNSTAPSSIVATPPEKTSSRRSSESRTPIRNRTPWDAGGYSLSLALDNTKKLVQGSPGAAAVSGSAPLASTTASAMVSSSDAMDLTGSCGSPKSASPRHKFSDSRSSFSSAYTIASSTNNSVSHSRISSLSTVSENQPLATLITDFSLLETGVSDPCTVHPHHGSQHSSQHGNQHHLQLQQYAFTTQGSPDRQDFQPESPTPVRSRHNLSIDASPGRSPHSPSRTRSPSDAMLITRTGPLTASSQAESGLLPSSESLRILHTHMRSHSREDLPALNDSQARCHKRAVSAPDFPSIGPTSYNRHFPTFGPIPEPTPSPSEHSDANTMERDSDSSSPTRARESPSGINGPVSASNSSTDLTSNSSGPGPLALSPRATSPTTVGPARHQSQASISSLADHAATAPSSELPVNFDVASACMYRGDCQTGSQLRKAISHIFGRNKLCTRMIPTGVWVHYCRKHYQRTRYRNGGEYPQRQIGLVQEQVRRVQAWSDSNVQQSRGPILKDWSLSVRKREQLRLDNKMAGGGKKRPFHEDGLEEEEENFDDDRAEMSGTAVPDWVVARIGDGYSTVEILGIVDQLKADIDQGRLQQIPDIEILPNIVTDSSSDEPAPGNGPKKSYTKRRTLSGANIGGGHRRSQSVNTSALRSDSVPMARRSSQPNNFLASSSSRMLAIDHLQLPLEKRQRVDSEAVEATRPVFASRFQVAHRPAFAGIRESQAESPAYYYPDEQRYSTNAESGYQGQPPLLAASSGPFEGEHHYSSGPAREEHERHHSNASSLASHSGYGVLPAPNPQRFGGPSVAQQLETSSYILNSAATRRTTVHQRSQSEAGFFHHLPSSQYGRPTSSGSHAPHLSFSGMLTLGGLPRISGAHTSSSEFMEEGPQLRNAGPASFSAARPGFGAGVHNQHHQHHSFNASHHHLGGHNMQHADPERRSSTSAQPGFGFGSSGHDAHQTYDKFESVQLPPLQSVQAAVAGRGERHMSSMSDFPGSARHSRHQSSPAVSRMLPATMEVSGAPPFHRPMQEN